MLRRLLLLPILAACGATEPAAPPIPVNSGQGDAAAGSASATGMVEPPAPRISTDSPEAFVRAVAESVRTENADAYLALTISTDDDFAALAAIMDHPPKSPGADERARTRERRAAKFRDVVEQLRKLGVDIRAMKIESIDTTRVARKGDLGFAEDMSFVVLSSSGEPIRVTIDDCVLTRRGWIIEDGLKLRGKP